MHKTRVSPMVCQGRRFHRSALLSKTAADSNDSNDSKDSNVFGPAGPGYVARGGPVRGSSW